MNFDKDTPIYLQLRDYFQNSILSGELPPGAPIPSTRSIANEAGVNANTVQHAMNLLVHVGMVKSYRGKGNFVIKDKEKIRNKRQKMMQTAIHDFLHVTERFGFNRDQIIEIVTQTIKNK